MRIKKYTRWDGRYNTKKLGGFITVAVPQKKLFSRKTNQEKHTKNLSLKFDS